MNYIKHFNHWLELVAIDDRLSASHISIYVALFQLWNKNRFPEKISISRSEVMQVSKIGSPKTYYKCLHELHEYGYIRYFPSYHPLKGSVISIQDLSDDVAPKANENSSESSDDVESEPAKKICASCVSTQVHPGQKIRNTYGKNDTGGTQAGKPLLLNNINLINYKQRERRAHARDEFKIKFLKNQEGSVSAGGGTLCKSDLSDGAQKSRSVSGSSSGIRLESKKSIRREISKPTLEQVKDFFTHQLSGKYFDRVLDADSRLVEAEKFFNHYESNGWLLGGKVPMRNWKASCRSWAAKIPYFTRVRSKQVDRLHAPTSANYAKPL